uniref:Matrix protein n=1 Tax=Pneumovirus dog/Brne17/USA/2008 TaxID=879294 RepID=F1ACP4_9MONO|nr:matrix protein [Pneumovirus dog/Brne17/USA/2008]
MEAYLVEMYHGVPYTAAIQLNLVEKHSANISLTVWIPMFQTSLPRNSVMDLLHDVTVICTQISTVHGPMIKVDLSSSNAGLATMPRQFLINAIIALDDWGNMEYEVPVAFDKKSFCVTILKPKNMLYTVPSITPTNRPTHELIAVCSFHNRVTLKSFTIPVFIRALSIRQQDLDSVERAISSDVDHAITTARVAPYAGLTLVINITSTKGAFKLLKAGCQILAELGPYLTQVSLHDVIMNWKHTGTSYILKSSSTSG